MTILVAALAAAVPSLGWVEWHRRHDERVAEVRNCYHHPGEPYLVKGSRNSYQHRCVKCNAFQHCNKDGGPYGPNDRWYP